MCKDHAVYSPSYPVDSMNVQDLQKAAMGPSRWYTNITGHAVDGSDVDVKVDWEPRLKQRIRIEVGVDACLCLVPGGRFLISGDNEYIKLWDMGAPWAPALQHPVLLAAEKVGFREGEFLGHIECDVFEDQVVYVIVWEFESRCVASTILGISCGLLTSAVRRHIYFEIDPSMTHPTFVQHPGGITLESAVSSTLKGKRVLFENELKNFIVLDILERRFVVLTLDKEQVEQATERVRTPSACRPVAS